MSDAQRRQRHVRTEWTGRTLSPFTCATLIDCLSKLLIAHSRPPQACYWFSNGASIGCPKPDGVTRGPIPSVKCSKSEPQFMCARKYDTCGSGARASICDSKLRTVNVDADCGAEDDFYYFSPWRSPGSAGVYDSCGMAGGTPHAGGFGGTYVETEHAKQGDLGSRTLSPRPTKTRWVAGSHVEVSWNILANHGGG